YLEVLGHEAERYAEHGAHPLGVQLAQIIEDIRPQPGLAGHAGALVAEAPLAQAEQLGDPSRALLKLLRVWVAPSQDFRRQAVSAEQHQHLFARRGREFRQRRYDPIGDQAAEQWVLVPALDEMELKRLGHVLQRLVDVFAVALQTVARVVRRQRHSDHLADTVGHDLLHDLADEWVPMLHPQIDPILAWRLGVESSL